MATLKTVYTCTQCGENSLRWMGKCPSCGAWNTMVEDVVAAEPISGGRPASASSARGSGLTTLKPQRLAQISTTEE